MERIQLNAAADAGGLGKSRAKILAQRRQWFPATNLAFAAMGDAMWESLPERPRFGTPQFLKLPLRVAGVLPPIDHGRTVASRSARALPMTAPFMKVSKDRIFISATCDDQHEHNIRWTDGDETKRDERRGEAKR